MDKFLPSEQPVWVNCPKPPIFTTKSDLILFIESLN